MWLLCVFMLGGSWLQGCCCFHFWRQPDAPTSKKNGKNFRNRVDNWYPKYSASEIYFLGELNLYPNGSCPLSQEIGLGKKQKHSY
jgi:hypothetical protein